MRIEEKILISELKKGNKEVLEALFMEYFPVLLRFADGYTFDSSASEDIVQALFVHLWEKADQIEYKTSVKAYLYQATRNRCLNHLRDLNIRDSHKLLYLEAIFNSQDPDHWTDEATLEEIVDAIDLLPSQMARIFRMKYFQGQKIAEIANHLSISENSVKTHLSRGKTKLRKELLHLQGSFFEE